jgi:uncharacterized membrane protein YfcA
MDAVGNQFLGMAGIDGWIFAGLTGAALLSAFISAVAGAAGGLILLGIMSLVFPPVLLIPLHTIVQLGASSAMVAIHWRYIMRAILPPFAIGAIVGAAIGGRVFIDLPESVLQLILGVSILVLGWAPRIARFGPERGRFLFVGFLTTFLGVFISATGTLAAAFTAAAAPDRRNHIATLGAVMGIVHIAKIVAFAVIGIGFGAYAPLLAAMIAVSYGGTWAAKLALDRIPERQFRLTFQVILTALALRLIWIAVEPSF